MTTRLVAQPLSGWGHMGGWGWPAMSLVMIGVLGLVVWAALTATRARDRSPLEILEERYARGEIDDDEFRRRRQTLADRRGRG